MDHGSHEELQALKIDPYLNTDAGLLNPLEYVQDDATRLTDTDRLLGMESASYWPTAAVSCPGRLVYVVSNA